MSLCRVEYLTPTGWRLGHSGINLLQPARYPERLGANGKFGRVTVLAADLQPTDEVYVTPGAPDDLSVLKPSYNHIPGIPAPQGHKPASAHVDLCEFCDDFHTPPFDGTCLI